MAANPTTRHRERNTDTPEAQWRHTCGWIRCTCIEISIYTYTYIYKYILYTHIWHAVFSVRAGTWDVQTFDVRSRLVVWGTGEQTASRASRSPSIGTTTAHYCFISAALLPVSGSRVRDEIKTNACLVNCLFFVTLHYCGSEKKVHISGSMT